jgi:dTDP-4-amino-4,6-dideoxygalactose transaminase
MTTKNFPPWPSFTIEEADAVRELILSNRVNYWTGEFARMFELEFAAWTGVPHSIALTNGTLALELALIGLGIGEGDEVIVTPRTFIASVSSVVSVGAIPVFADVDPESGNINANTIANVVTDKTRAIIPVHLGGWPCDMDGIMALAQAQNLLVIEDCAQAHGAKVGKRMVGSIGHAGAWSFCQDKIMTTGGEGGMVTTDNEKLWKKMWSYKDHGKNWDAVYNKDHQPGFRWLHESFGTNWRMLEVQAAIGRIQLKRMDDWSTLRKRNARALQKTMQAFPGAVRVAEPDIGFTHAYYRQYGYVKPDGLKSGWTRDRILEDIVALGFPAFQGSCSEVYLEKAFDGSGWRPEQRLPVARELGETSVMFLTHPTITESELGRYCKAISDVFKRASK